MASRQWRVLIGSRALTQAVAQIEALRTELDLTEADLGVAVREAMRARAQVQEYENAITWDTTCLNCSKLLDASYEETSRREVAEHRLGSLEQDMFAPHGGAELLPMGLDSGARFTALRRWVGEQQSVTRFAQRLLRIFGPKDDPQGDWRDYIPEAERLLAP